MRVCILSGHLAGQVIDLPQHEAEANLASGFAAPEVVMVNEGVEQPVVETPAVPEPAIEPAVVEPAPEPVTEETPVVPEPVTEAAPAAEPPAS